MASEAKHWVKGLGDKFGFGLRCHEEVCAIDALTSEHEAHDLTIH